MRKVRGAVHRGLVSTLALSMGVLALSGAAIADLTLGLRAFTEERARQIEVRESPRALLSVPLEDHLGQPLNLGHTERDPRVAIVMFMYARCTTLCAVTTAQYRILQSRIEEAGLQDHVRLITVSFDPEYDTREVLAQTADRVGADAALWRFARPANAESLQPLLDQFGIWVLPLENGEFEHNAAFHVLDHHGRLARIVPVDSPDWALWEAADIAVRAAERGNVGQMQGAIAPAEPSV